MTRERGAAACCAALLALASCTTASERPRAAADWLAASMSEARFAVNRETRGMSSRVRWVISPDSSTLIVVDDPRGVESEAVPDGALIASERTGRAWRIDSLWSIAPSPDWRRIAVGRAVMLGGGEQQRVDRARWSGAAEALVRIGGPHPSLTADSLRAHSFPASGMAVVEGAAATFIADLGVDSTEPSLRFATLGGWRLGWSSDATTLLVGERPSRVQDDSPAAATRPVALSGTPVAKGLPADSVRWVIGPALDMGAPVAIKRVAEMQTRSRSITARDGRILVADSSAAPRDIGPGIPLAATRGGHFILAIAPRQNARSFESPDEAVVYRVP